ncbi:ABC transporter ATP-binding protein [Methanococcoides sp. FTZ1]|uniref:ABC transporter ATP-binding protein n=1 Tax=Methanococcoides sp. FTZ1 TaxID=3439061 RepID=UPI003F82B25B
MGVEISIQKKFYNKDAKKGGKETFSLGCDFKADNELVVLFGRSGSGKTTTLRCIAGLAKPDSGYIRINDDVYFDHQMNIDLPSQQRHLGYVFQNYALFPHMDVRKNIAYGLKGMDTLSIQRRVDEMMELMQIGELENCYPAKLSGGQQQRVALARALAPEPQILLLDEPFSALDMVSRIRLRAEMKSIQKELGIPMLFITHNPVEAFTMADRVVVYHDGVVQHLGSPEDVFYHPKTRHVAELAGLSNIFDDAVVVDHDKSLNSTILRTQDILITAQPLDCMLGERVSWGIRPENILLLDEREGQKKQRRNLFPAIITSIVNKGASSLVSVEIVGKEIMLVAEIANNTFNDLMKNVGDKCVVQIKKKGIVVFDRNDKNIRSKLSGRCPVRV